MPAGDWVSTAFIEIIDGSLPQLAAGVASFAQVDYNVILPSGNAVRNGGAPGLAPFQFQGSSTTAINLEAMELVAALAAYEGLDVHLTTGIMHPDGTFSPFQVWSDVSGRFALT